MNSEGVFSGRLPLQYRNFESYRLQLSSKKIEPLGSIFFALA